MRPGRIFLRRMIDELKRVPSWANGTTPYPLSPGFQLDVQWWLDFASDWNGKSLLLHPAQQQCKKLLAAVLQLFAELGLPVAADKLAEPSQTMVFLGVLFDTIAMTMSLEAARLQALLTELQLWRRRTHASRAELQSLIGVLAFAASEGGAAGPHFPAPHD